LLIVLDAGDLKQTPQVSILDWRHSGERLDKIRPRDTEVIVVLDGGLRVRRRGDGQLQHRDALPGTVWL
jgi:hypothetical protein